MKESWEGEWSWVDSHAHLDRVQQADTSCSIDSLLREAEEQRVSHVLTVGTSAADSIQNQANRALSLFSSVGIHPHEVGEEDSFAAILPYALHENVVGIGETGLDFSRNPTKKERTLQIDRFAQHIELSLTTEKPVIVHTRSAFAETLAILQAYPGVQGVIHCFTERREAAAQLMEIGFFLSFSGIITFARNEALREVVRYVPLDRILVETDAPFLTPVPHRGKINRPAFVVYTGEMVAAIKGLPVWEVAQQTTRNFFSLFSTKAEKGRMLHSS